MKKLFSILFIAVLVVSVFTAAYADDFYLYYASTTSWYRTGSMSSRGSTPTAYINQEGNVNTVTSYAGGKVRYGTNTVNSSATNYFTSNYETPAGDSATIRPTVSSSVNQGTPMYLNLKALTAPSVGQWEISGYWHG